MTTALAGIYRQTENNGARGPRGGLAMFAAMEACMGGPIRMKAVAAALEATAAACTPCVDRGEKEGWLERMNMPLNRQAVLVRLTPAGRKKLEAIYRAAGLTKK